MDIKALSENQIIMVQKSDLESFARAILNGMEGKQTDPEPDSPMSEKEFRAWLGGGKPVSRGFLYKLRKAGKLKVKTLGGRIFYFKSDLTNAKRGK